MRILRPMTHETRSERTVRLLTLRLDELASALERSGAATGAVAHLLELASIATTHAVMLELLTSERAEEVWAAAAQRHPVLTTMKIRGPSVRDRVAA